MVKNGEIISKIIRHVIQTIKNQKSNQITLSENENMTRVLFLRTPTTGDWLDSIDVKNDNDSKWIQIERKLYIPQNNDVPFSETCNVRCERSDVEIFSTYRSFQIYLKKKQKQGTRYDLIAVDTCHAYNTSLKDFIASTGLLSENGVLISHDCSPDSEYLCNTKYQPGSWCGCTFMAFVKLVHDFPSLCYYTILDIDTGIGIFTRTKSLFKGTFLETVLEQKQTDSKAHAQQKKCLELFSTEVQLLGRLPKTFQYFRTHGSRFINLIEYKNRMCGE